MLPVCYTCICGYTVCGDNFAEVEAKMRHYDANGNICWFRQTNSV